MSAEPRASAAERLTISGRAIRLDRANVDTDLIIPSRFIKRLDREGLGEGAFAALRGSPGNPFEELAATGAPILMTGPNFGCGSSREHAVWALQQIGIRAVLAPSFASIFEANALRNGLIPVRLAGESIERLMRLAADVELTVDAARQVVVLPGGDTLDFPLDPFWKSCLIEGVDGVGLGLERTEQISAYEENSARQRPWEQQVPWDRLEEDA